MLSSADLAPFSLQQQCFNSVIESGLGCDSGDNECLCANQNFGWGLQDCAQEACDAEVSRQLVAFSESLCAGE